MAHLGFGGRLIQGAVDAAPPEANRQASHRPSWVQVCRFPKGSRMVPARTIEQALGPIEGPSGQRPADRVWCIDPIRDALVSGLPAPAPRPQEASAAPPARSPGYPDFAAWPRWDGLVHQKMWVEWLRRAHEHGSLRVLVGLAVNSRTLAQLLGADPPFDDRATADLQIRAMKQLADAHAWIEVATSTRALREIVSRGQLALVLGVELDDLGGFLHGPNPTAQTVSEEVDRLWQLGVRYVFPVHLIDNAFGGTALYEPMFETSNLVENSRFFETACSAPEDRIDFVYEPIQFTTVQRAAMFLRFCNWRGDCGYRTPATRSLPRCPGGTGHVNPKGLTALGRHLLEDLMRRGMLIDVDHLSQAGIDDALDVAQTFGAPGVSYPLNAGHNGVRGNAGRSATERNLSPRQVRELAETGGVFGVGSAGSSVATFVDDFSQLARLAGSNRGLALGTDSNGLEPTPPPPCASHEPECRATRYRDFYTPAFPRSQTGNRTWDYPTEGVAHYGLFADFLRDVARYEPPANTPNTLGGREVSARLLLSAERFAQMWERAEAVRQCHANGDCRARACRGGASAGTSCTSNRQCLAEDSANPGDGIVGECAPRLE